MISLVILFVTASTTNAFSQLSESSEGTRLSQTDELSFSSQACTSRDTSDDELSLLSLKPVVGQFRAQQKTLAKQPQGTSQREPHIPGTRLLQRFAVPHLTQLLPDGPLSVSVMIVPVLVGFVVLLLSCFTCLDFSGHGKEEPTMAVNLALGASMNAAAPEPASAGAELQRWSIKAIMVLTSYRFYTGFLGATWMPYLLAMEGHELTLERQSIFMGSAKLIYGFSILLNPLFGLVGDQVAGVSHWSGRSLFILVGVAVSGLGIYGCLVAAHIQSVAWYLLATVLWMLGEAMADVTTETLVPELLPRSQYEVSSNIRALHFLLGGLAGYVMIIVASANGWHYSWMYYAYLILMTLCAMLSLLLISTGEAQPARPSANGGKALWTFLAKAYILPTRIEGGFPKACLCLFLFSLGTAPMFFLMLMVRDIIGIYNQDLLQMHFSLISIVFFLCAALASTLGALTSCFCNTRRSTSDAQSSSHARSRRWPLVVMSTVLFAFVCAVIPAAGIFKTYGARLTAYYMFAGLFGFSFGSVYARFQDCIWSLLPNGGDIANLMGFAAMSKLAGVGIGNFVAGLILDHFAIGDTYEFKGYILMCAFCAVVVGVAAVLAWSVGQTALAAEEAATRRSEGQTESAEFSADRAG